MGRCLNRGTPWIRLPRTRRIPPKKKGGLRAKKGPCRDPAPAEGKKGGFPHRSRPREGLKTLELLPSLQAVVTGRRGRGQKKTRQLPVSRGPGSAHTCQKKPDVPLRGSSYKPVGPWVLSDCDQKRKTGKRNVLPCPPSRRCQTRRIRKKVRSEQQQQGGRGEKGKGEGHRKRFSRRDNRAAEARD